MFTRRIIMRIRPDCAAALALVIKDEVAPVLRSYEGMRHEETFISPGMSEAVINSYWVTEEHAEAYNRTAYAEALRALAGVIEGVPAVETFTVSSSTFHKLTAGRRKAYRDSMLGREVAREV